VPTIHVRSDGIIGVAYYDFRDNTSSNATLPTVARLATSSDGITWYESEIESPFNLNTAPIARGYFLGDYIGLTARGGAFHACYARTTGLAPDNRTEIVFASIAEGSLMRAQKSVVATLADDDTTTPPTISPEFRERVNRNIDRVLELRKRGTPKAPPQ
jgi:hypothetical protein